jgi:hypothetical protein
LLKYNSLGVALDTYRGSCIMDPVMRKETNMNCDLLTPRTVTRLSPLMWANMVLDLEKIGLNGKVLLTATDEYLIELHEVYFPVPFDTN